MRSRRAISLIEVVISSALISIIFIGVGMIVDKGLRFYRLNTAINDRQREVLAFLARFSAELQDTNSDTIFIDPAPGSGSDPKVFDDSRGISYGLAINEQGQADLDPVTGQLRWQGYGVFYRDASGDLYWYREFHVDPSNPTARLQPPPSLRPEGLVSSRKGKILARQVTDLTFKFRQTDDNAQSVPKGFYEVVVDCGDKNDTQGYWLQLKTSVYPRN